MQTFYAHDPLFQNFSGGIFFEIPEGGGLKRASQKTKNTQNAKKKFSSLKKLAFSKSRFILPYEARRVQGNF